MALSYSSDLIKAKRLFVAVSHWQLLVTKTASTVRANLILMHLDAILAKIKNNICFEYFMDVGNSPLSGSSEFC